MADHSDLIFFNSDGELENATKLDKLVFNGGLGTSDEDISGDLNLTSGAAAAGDSGDIVLTTGGATGVRGSVLIDALNLDLNGTQIINVAAPTLGTDAANKTYVDAVAEGLKPKEAVRVATTEAVPNLAAGPLTIDGITLVEGDRVLVKDSASIDGVEAVDDKRNGIYIVGVIGTDSGTWIRATDMDSLTPIDEVNGAYVPVQEGVDNQGKFYVQSGVVATLETDALIFVYFNAISTLSAGLGIDATQFASNIIQMDLIANGGLIFTGQEVGVDFATLFTIDAASAKAIKATEIASTTVGKGAAIVGISDASGYYAGNNAETAFDEIEAQIGGLTSTTVSFTEQNVVANNDVIYAAIEKLDLKWGDLASVNTGEGASLVGLEDLAEYFTATDSEAAFKELYEFAATGGAPSYLAATGGVAKGDLLRFSGNGEVTELDNTSGAAGVYFGFAMAFADAAGATLVQLVHDGKALAGLLDGTTFAAGDKVYYDSAATGTARFVKLPNSPSGVGSKSWQVGIAASTTELMIDINFGKKNA